MVQRVYNFSPGPAVLPLPVLEEAQRDLVAMPGVGSSVLEISHRSKKCDEILQTAKSNLKSLLKIPDNYKVLFLQGGATLQFSMIPASFLPSGKSADYILTGSWGDKAVKEAKKAGTMRLAWSGKADNYVRVPKQDELELDSNAAYVHYTSNETIQGVEFMTEPNVGGVPLMCDASSDILSRPLDISKYALLYAGAQKNMGPSGVTLVIIRDDLLEQVPENLPSMLDYKQLAENDSLLNTPPVFGIYMIMLVTNWLLNEVGGLEKMQEINKTKAALLYDAVDNSNGFYQGHAQADCRSLMNVTWRMGDDEREKKFIEEAKAAGLTELKGHRSVGGMRASIYNAMPMDGVQKLSDFMVEFQKKNS